MVNVYHLDLEYLQALDNSPDTLNLVEKTLEVQLLKLSNMSDRQRRQTLVLGFMMWENCPLSGSPTKSLLESINDKVNSLGAVFHLIAGINYQTQLADVNYKITFINLCALRTHIACSKQTVSDRWFVENNKILFLMGKAYKRHRVGLLYQLYKRGLLADHRCVWSCIQLDLDLTKRFLPWGLSDEDISKFIKSCYRVADSINLAVNDNINTHYGGFPFDVELYKQTNISLISETSEVLFPGGLPIVSEKTYRAIVNNHPFVIAALPGQNKELQRQGFFTFEEFMTFPAYNEQSINLKSLEEIAENVKNFNPAQDEIPTINSMIQHNARRFNELIQEESSKLQSVLDLHGVDQGWQDIFPWEDSPNQFLTWQFYYQTIKDPSWPPCESVEDCNKLPQKIQHELRTVFKVIF